MKLEFDMPKEKRAFIKVIGVGGAGTNAVNHMYSKGIKGVEFLVANTDEQHLHLSPVSNRILLGPELTRGLGTGADPEIGKRAAEESMLVVKEELMQGTKMLFIAAGMGKGTGTGGSPVIARMAKEMGILTVAIVTTPLDLLGKAALRKSEDGLAKLKENVDALIIIDNNKILKEYGSLKAKDAMAMADDILANAAKGIAEIITGAGISNTDFMDVKNVLTNGGMTIMGIGYAKGESRATLAANNALQSPLLNDYNIKGAQKALVNISYSEEHECTLSEIGDILEVVRDAAQCDIEILHGTAEDNTLGEEIAVTVVVTGFSIDSNTTAPVQENQNIIIQVDKAPSVEPIFTPPTVKSDIIVVESEKQITIDFGLPLIQTNTNELFSDNFNLNSVEVEEDNDIQITERESVTLDNTGRVIDETDEERRKRLLSNISHDVNSPLYVDQLDLGIDPISHKSTTMISDNRFGLFKDDNKTKTITD